MDFRALQHILSMCVPKPIQSEMVKPKITVFWTRSMPGMRGGRAMGLDLGRLTTISLVIAWFNLRLLMDAHCQLRDMVKFRKSAVNAGSRDQLASSYRRHI